MDALPPGRFQKTRWRLVRTLGASDPQSAGAALGELCEIYWYPIYAFIRRSGHSSADAEDHTQSFFAELLGRDDFQNADPQRGKLRSYLIGAVKHSLSRQRDKDRALRRGGGAVSVSIDQARPRRSMPWSQLMS